MLYPEGNRANNAYMTRKQVNRGNPELSKGEDEISFEDLLVDVGQNQNKESFIQLFEHFAPRIKSFLIKGGANESNADELAQETMLNVWNKAGSYEPQKAAASTWIFTVARNKRIDALRKKKSYDLDIDDMFFLEDENSPNPVKSLSHKEEMDNLYDAIQELPEEQAQLIKKSFYEDKTHNEIADETGIPLGTVKSRIRLALERLRGDSKVKQLWQ